MEGHRETRRKEKKKKILGGCNERTKLQLRVKWKNKVESRKRKEYKKKWDIREEYRDYNLEFKQRKERNYKKEEKEDKKKAERIKERQLYIE